MFSKSSRAGLLKAGFRRGARVNGATGPQHFQDAFLDEGLDVSAAFGLARLAAVQQRLAIQRRCLVVACRRHRRLVMISRMYRVRGTRLQLFWQFEF